VRSLLIPGCVICPKIPRLLAVPSAASQCTSCLSKQADVNSVASIAMYPTRSDYRRWGSFSLANYGLLSRAVSGLNHATVGNIRRMSARDHWVETLTCRRCRRIGIAHLSTEDRLSWTVEVHSVSEGFKVIQSENGSNFYCSSCERPVEP
jgi:hypothetical protein